MSRAAHSWRASLGGAHRRHASVTAADLDRLRKLARDRNAPQKHVWRAQIVLPSAEGAGTNAIIRETGKSKACVWRSQERFAAEGFEGILHDKTRPSRIPKHDPAVAERVVALTMETPPGEATHWTGAAMAEAAQGLRQFGAAHLARSRASAPSDPAVQLSRDPEFVDKLRDVVGLHVDPPAHAVVFFGRREEPDPGPRPYPADLPIKKGRAGTMTHDYKRHGTTTLLAAMNVLDGTVIGRNMQRHRHQEFIRFLNAIEREIPAGKTIHAILDSYADHKHPKVRKWLARNPRWTFHFTPTSASWLNAVEGSFPILTKRRLKRGIFRSVTTCRPPSTVSSTTTTPIPNRSNGSPTPTKSSPP
jgi:transposase